MAHRILALDCGAYALKAALLERGFGEVRLLGLWSQPRDPHQASAEQLRQFCTSHQLQADTVLTCLPGDAVSHRFLTLPFSRVSQISQTVPFELETQTPFDLEEMLFDFYVIESGPTGSRVLAVAVPKKTLSQHLETCAAAGLDPAAVEIAPLAPVALLQMANIEQSGSVCLLDLGESRTSLVLLRDGALCGMRTLSVGLGQVGGVGRFIQEVGWTLSTLRHSQQAEGEQNDEAGEDAGEEAREDAPPRFVLCGGGAHVAPLRDELQNIFETHVLALHELDLSAVPAAYQEEQAIFAGCLGLGFGYASPLSTPRINLRQGEYAYREQYKTQGREWRRLGRLSAGVVAAASLAFGVEMYRLDTQYQMLRQEVRHIFRETLPTVQTIVSEKLQLEDAVAMLHKRHQTDGGAAASPLEVLRWLSAALPERIRLDLEEVVIDGGTVRLRGTADSFDAVEAVKIAASKLEFFQEVQLQDVKTLAGRKKVSFQLNLRTL